MTFRERDLEGRSRERNADEVREGGSARLLERMIVGSSRAMRQVRRRIDALSRTRVPVLVCGEPGTGRDCVVNALHRLREGPDVALVKISCASPGTDKVPPDAPAVYLDEIADLPARAQELWLEQLLAAWKDPGSHRPRVYASTPADLTARAREGTFHAGLAKVLHRRTVALPPLRERKEDLPALTSTLLQRSADRCGLPTARILRGGLARMKEHAWRHNVRGLEEVLERLTAYSADGRITAADVDDAFNEDPESVAVHRRMRERREYERTAAALVKADGNVKVAAEELGISTTALRHRAQKWGLMPRPKPKRTSRSKAAAGPRAAPKSKRKSKPRAAPRPDPGSGQKQP